MSATNQQPTENKENTWLKKASMVAAATALTAGIVISNFSVDIAEVLVNSKNQSKSKAIMPIIGTSIIVGIVAVAIEEIVKSLKQPDTKVVVQEHAKLQLMTQHTGKNY